MLRASCITLPGDGSSRVTFGRVLNYGPSNGSGDDNDKYPDVFYRVASLVPSLDSITAGRDALRAAIDGQTGLLVFARGDRITLEFAPDAAASLSTFLALQGSGGGGGEPLPILTTLVPNQVAPPFLLPSATPATRRPNLLLGYVAPRYLRCCRLEYANRSDDDDELVLVARPADNSILWKDPPIRDGRITRVEAAAAASVVDGGSGGTAYCSEVDLLMLRASLLGETVRVLRSSSSIDGGRVFYVSGLSPDAVAGLRHVAAAADADAAWSCAMMLTLQV